MKNFPFFKGDGIRSKEPLKLPVTSRNEYARSEFYIPDPGLIDAVNVALALGQPLLLTGEPGTGKTQLAYYIAWELGLPEPFKFETKSTSTSKDIFYSYDALRRFQDAQSNISSSSALPYINYNALGLAIIFSWNPDATLMNKEGVDRPLKEYLPEQLVHPGKQRSIVLIDEIDKAPRDVPNDILNEIDQMYFRIPELDNFPISANPDFFPIIVLTSNSEKDLPSAFLRRCIYYNIPFPDVERMTLIITKRLGWFSNENQQFVHDAVRLFYRMRNKGLRKEPSTAELLDWISALRLYGDGIRNPISEKPELIEKSLGALIKNSEDIKDAKIVLDEWRADQQKI